MRESFKRTDVLTYCFLLMDIDIFLFDCALNARGFIHYSDGSERYG